VPKGLTAGEAPIGICVLRAACLRYADIYFFTLNATVFFYAVSELLGTNDVVLLYVLKCILRFACTKQKYNALQIGFCRISLKSNSQVASVLSYLPSKFVHILSNIYLLIYMRLPLLNRPGTPYRVLDSQFSTPLQRILTFRPVQTPSLSLLFTLYHGHTHFIWHKISF